MNQDRKDLIHSFNHLPIMRLQAALDAKKNGCSDNMCAAAAGLPYDELMYMLKLGMEGHRVWQEFYQMWRRAEYINTLEVWQSVKQRAISGASTDLETFLEHNDSEYLARRQYKEQNNGRVSSLPVGITINVARFDSPESLRALPGNIIDTEAEEV